MISAASAAGIAFVSLAMVLTPGPNMIYLVSRALSQGRRAGLLSLIGTVTGFLIYLAMASLGVAGVFLTAHWLYQGLTLAGAAYLLRLAWQALQPGGGLFQARELPRDPAAKLLWMGLRTNLLNPKAAVLYLALIPQFITSGRPLIVQAFALGGIQIAVSAAVNAVIVLAASGVSAFLGARPRWLRWQRRVTATLLAAVALHLALSGVGA